MTRDEKQYAQMKQRNAILRGVASGAEASRQRPEPRWLMGDVVPLGGYTVLLGAPGCGKSFFALGLACSVSRGVPFMGQPVKQAGVLYLALEGQQRFTARVAAYAAHHGLNGGMGDGFHLGMNPVPMTTSQHATDAIEAVRALSIRHRVELIVIDTVSRALAGADENAGGMVAFVACITQIAAKTGATVLCVHHTGKDASRGGRGHTSLLGGAEAEITLTKRRTGIEAITTKQRDAPYGFKLTFEIEAEEPSAVAVPVCADAVKSRRAEVLHGKRQNAVLAAIAEMSADVCCPLSPGGVGWPDGGTPTPDLEAVIAYAASGLPKPEDGKDRRREYVRRVIDQLQARSEIAVHTGTQPHRVWKC